MTSRWRPKNRRQILQLDDEGSQSPSVQNNTTTNNPSVPASAPTNKLHALLGHYNSDDDESSKEEEDSEFKDFMNEIKSAEENPTPPIPSVWQELWDPQSGQPYYWHTVTNELTWDKPKDLVKPPAASKPTVDGTKVISKPTLAVEEKTVPPGTSTIKQELHLPSVSKTLSTLPTPSTVEGPSLPAPPKGDMIRKDDGKVSFKIGAVEKNNAKSVQSEMTQAKTNGRLTIDVDSIIAAIEKEVPPDHKTETFVPLFRRRPQQESRPKLGNDFKKFFPPTHQPVLDLEPGSASPPTIVNTFKGLGYQEKEDTPVSTPVQKVQFIAGEILKPMVPVAPVVPLTVAQKITRLENHLTSTEPLPSALSNVQLTAQLEILKEAWNQKKLQTDFLEEWLETIETKLKEEPVKLEVQQDQVIDMVLDDSGSENPGTPAATESSAVPAATTSDEVGECLDSALNSFYTDLASLDTVPVDPPPVEPAVTSTLVDTTSQQAVTSVAETVTNVAEEETSSEPMKGIKRSKMSSDMTSLVAKWQKIHQANT